MTENAKNFRQNYRKNNFSSKNSPFFAKTVNFRRKEFRENSFANVFLSQLCTHILHIDPFLCRPEASPDESSTSSDLDDDFRQRLDDEAGQEYFEFEGKFRDYDTKDFSEETYNDWADRIFAEYRRKTRPATSEAPAKAAEARLPETPKKTLKLKPPEKKDTSIKKDLYLFKFKKLFRSKEAIALRDLPFSLTSTSEEIVGTILSAEDADSRKHLREALRVWHPDKFNQLTQGRVSEEADRKAMSEIVTHVSQVLINYGKTKV